MRDENFKELTVSVIKAVATHVIIAALTTFALGYLFLIQISYKPLEERIDASEQDVNGNIDRNHDTILNNQNINENKFSKIDDQIGEIDEEVDEINDKTDDIAPIKALVENLETELKRFADAEENNTLINDNILKSLQNIERKLSAIDTDMRSLKERRTQNPDAEIQE